MIILHKRNEIVKLPIKYNFSYKVKSKNGYEEPIEKQKIHFEGKLYKISFNNGSSLRLTPDHPHIIFDDNGNQKQIKVENLKIGNISEDSNGNKIKIVNIEKIDYNGFVYDFTMPNENFYVNDILTHNCCRLRLDLTQLDHMSAGGIGSAREKTGSIGVITINLPRIGYLSKTKDDLFKRLGELMDISKDALELKRSFLEKELKYGLYPYTKRYLGNFNNHFGTIGLVGMNELCENFIHKNIGTEEGKNLSIEILDFMRKKISDFQVQTKHIYNLESSPAESTAYRLAKHDKEKYPDIITAGTIDSPYYTNSSNLPVGYTSDVWEALANQENLQEKYTGGTVFHTFLGEEIHDWKKVRDFIKKVFENTRIPYLTISPTYSICSHGHGYIQGDSHGVCPICKQEQIDEYNKKLEELEKEKEEILKEMENQ